MHEPSVPLRPPLWEERLASRLFLALSPRLPRTVQPAPPPTLAPFEQLAVPRSRGPGTLSATWYPAGGAAEGGAEGTARGAVLLLPPWVQWGRSYFHHRGRIDALRRAGYHALTLDFPGFGSSGAPAGLFDRDVEDGLDFLRRRAGSLPVHVWGISSGGYWTHVALSRTDGIAGAVFEDVSPHLFEWSWRMQPWGRPGYLFFHCAYRRAYRYMNVRRHAAALSVAAVSYIGGDNDPGIRREETEELARLAGGRCLIVAGAGHLASIKLAQAEILEMALDTFQRAESSPRFGSANAPAHRFPPPAAYLRREPPAARTGSASEP